jgi:hypothetical protein
MTRLLCVAALVLASVPATAQTRPAAPAAPAAPRFEVGGGLLFFGSAPFGAAAATETSSSGGRYDLFQTASRLDSASGPEARVGIRVLRHLWVQADASYATPRIETRIDGDVEGATGLTATETIRQITIGGSVLAELPRWRIASRGVPFVTAGAGYLRQLHEGQTLVQTGRTYSAGGGVQFLFRQRPRGHLKGFGVRADVRAVARTNGVAIDGRTHVSPALAVSAFARF